MKILKNPIEKFWLTRLKQLHEIDRKYDELIMAVQSKFPGETRHETALRYIKDREHGQVVITGETAKDFKEVTLKAWPAKGKPL